MRRLIVALVLLVIASSMPVLAQGGFHDKKVARDAAKLAPQPLSSQGTEMQVPKSSDAVYAAVANWVNSGNSGYEIDLKNSSKDAGMLVTTIIQTDGGVRKNGHRLRFTIVGGDKDTTVRVVAEKMTKLGLDPWSSDKGQVDQPVTDQKAAILKVALGVSPNNSSAPAVSIASKAEPAPVARPVVLNPAPVSVANATFTSNESGAIKFVAPFGVAEAWDTIVSWVRSTYGSDGLDKEATSRDTLEISTNIVKIDDMNGIRTLVSLGKVSNGTEVVVTAQQLTKRVGGVGLLKKIQPWSAAKKSVSSDASQAEASKLATAFGIAPTSNGVTPK